MVELLWKNTIVYAALEDQHVKCKVYKPNHKSVHQLNLKKKHLRYVNESWDTNYCHHVLLTTETMW